MPIGTYIDEFGFPGEVNFRFRGVFHNRMKFSGFIGRDANKPYPWSIVIADLSETRWAKCAVALLCNQPDFDELAMRTEQSLSSNIKRSAGWVAVLPSLVTPVCLGLSLYFGLQYLIDHDHIRNETLLRYITGHPVSKVTVGMFLVGLASLALIAHNVFEQFNAANKITLKNADPTQSTGSRGANTARESAKLGVVANLVSGPLADTDSVPASQSRHAESAILHGETMIALPKWLHTHYLWGRLVNALHFIYRTSSVAGVEDEMKYLAEMDYDRQQQRYSLSRILIWATPMLGFLGTVLGISQALGGIAVGPENDFQEMMNGLRGSLYVAFDTTALALTLSMVLMFVQFLVDRFETQLLEMVDQKTRGEIAGHFDLTHANAGGEGLGPLGAEVLEATRAIVRDQTEIWKNSIRSAEQAWTASLSQTSDVVQSNLTEALDHNVSNLAHYLGEAIEKADLSIAHRWEQWQTLLSDNARLMRQHQESLLSQTEQVNSIVGKLDNSTSFQQALVEQEKAIQATTQMHDLLNRVAGEIASQIQTSHEQTELLASVNQGLQRQRDELDRNHHDASFESDRQAPTVDPVPASPSPSDFTKTPSSSDIAIAESTPKPPAKHQSDVVFGDDQPRRRNPNKPVIFIRPEEVTAIRHATENQSPAPVSDQQKTAPEIKQPKRVISIHSLKSQPGLTGAGTDDSPDLVMPLPERMEGRQRLANNPSAKSA